MSDFTLLYPEWLTGLLPVALFIGWLMRRTGSTTLISPHLAKAMGVEKHDSSKLLLGLALVWTLTIIALAGPSFGKHSLPTMSNNSARVLVMDMSRSMYATDNKPDRLTQARYKASDLLNQWREGYTGLVAYAGDAYTVSPMTSDTATIKTLLPSLDPQIMPYQGADASRGVAKAIGLMKNAGFASGSVILVCDDLDKNEAEHIEELIKGHDWKLIILGMGSEVGAPVPQEDGSLLKTESGQAVIAKSNFKQMSELTDQVSGLFIPVQADNRDISSIIQAEQSALLSVSQNHQRQTITNRINHGFWLTPLILLAALGLFRRGFIFGIALIVAITFQPDFALASPWLNADQQAKQQYDAKHYQDAAKQFNDPEWRGMAQYQAGDYKGAVESLSSIPAPDNRQKYNLANAYAKLGDLKQAEQLYQSVLQQQPDNPDAQHNLKQVQKALKQQQQQQQQQKDKQNHNQDKKPEKQNSHNQQNAGQSGTNNKQDTAGKSQQDHSGTENSEQPRNRHPDHKKQQNASPDKQSGSGDKKTAAKEQPGTRTEQSLAQGDNKQNQPAGSAQENSQASDPELRKLEQVENARDPSALLRAQLFLQAQRQEPPKDTGKSW